MMPQSSDTVSSWRSSSSRRRLLVVSASDARWSRMAGARVLKVSYISVNPDVWIKRHHAGFVKKKAVGELLS